MHPYRNLDQMLCDDPQAGALFDSLPDYVQDSIRQRGGNVRSLDELQAYADNLLQGDH